MNLETAQKAREILEKMDRLDGIREGILTDDITGEVLRFGNDFHSPSLKELGVSAETIAEMESYLLDDIEDIKECLLDELADIGCRGVSA